MDDSQDSKEELLRELATLRERNAELEGKIRVRQQVESALRDSEHQYRQLVEHSRGFICIHTLDGHLLYVNPTSVQEIGYLPTDLIGQNMEAFIAPSVRHEFADYLKRIRNNRTDNGLLLVVTKDGEERVWSYRNVRYDEPGQASYVIGHAQDVTAQVEAEQKLRQAQHTLEQRVEERTRALRQANTELHATLAEHARAVAAQSEAEEKYRTLVNYATDAIVIVQDEQIVYANAAAEQLTGYTLDDVTRMTHTFTDFVVPEERLRLRTNYRKRLRGEYVPDHYETVVLTKDGRRLIVDLKPCVIPFQGNPGVMIMIRDITMQKQGETALRESEQRYRTLVEGSIQGISVRDRHGSQVFANTALAKIFGYDHPQELIGLSMLDRIAPHERDRLRDISSARFRGVSRPSRIIYQGVRKDGTLIWLENVVSMITWEDQPAQLTTLVDITERKQAEEALRQSEERFAKAFQSCPIPMGIVRLSDGHILDMNDRFLHIMDCQRDHLGGESAVTLEQWATNSDYQKLLHLLTTDETVRDFATELETQSGDTLDVLLSAELIEISDEACMLVTIYDVTERKYLEDQLRQTQKMEALGTLAGGVAHEYNNMLTAILGFTQLAGSEIQDGHPAHEYLQHVLDSGRRAKELVQHILTFSRQNKPEPQSISFPNLVKESLILARATLPTTIAIEQDIATDAGIVHADPTHLHQVLMNLFTNAEHAMRDADGVLSVSLQALDIEANQSYAANLLPVGHYVHLQVTDTGHGMSAETLERIFEPFFTTKAIGDGTGMGLAIVHGIVSSHGGVITAMSLPGSGTTFDLYLPRLAASTLEPSAPIEDAAPRGTGRILFVDDEILLAHLGQQMLERLGYEPVSFTNSADALEAFRAAPDDFDLIITDQTMPHLTGERLVEELRRIRPKLPIILCTGFSYAMDAEKAQRLGIDAFLMKPIETQELAVTIQRVLSKEL